MQYKCKFLTDTSLVLPYCAVTRHLLKPKWGIPQVKKIVEHFASYSFNLISVLSTC